MPACILRYAGTKGLAGLYTADSENDLFDLIDEETNPQDYEYAIIRDGYGIEFRKGEWNVRYKIGSGTKKLHAALSKTDGIYMTDRLLDALTRGEGLTWRKLYES